MEGFLVVGLVALVAAAIFKWVDAAVDRASVRRVNRRIAENQQKLPS